MPSHPSQQIQRDVMRFQTVAAAGSGQAGHAVEPGDLATRAYYRYLDRGAQPGSDVRDWLDAESDQRTESLAEGRRS